MLHRGQRAASRFQQIINLHHETNEKSTCKDGKTNSVLWLESRQLVTCVNKQEQLEKSIVVSEQVESFDDWRPIDRTETAGFCVAGCRLYCSTAQSHVYGLVPSPVQVRRRSLPRSQRAARSSCIENEKSTRLAAHAIKREVATFSRLCTIVRLTPRRLRQYVIHSAMQS